MKNSYFFVPVLFLLFVGASAQAAPNDAAGLSPEQSSQFKGNPKNPSLLITNVFATSTTATSTEITWNTNKESDSYVYYWIGTTTPTTTIQVYDLTKTLNHRVILTGLQENSVYSYFVKSTKPIGRKTVEATTSPVYIFKTLQGYPPVSTSFTNPTPDYTIPYIKKIGEIAGLNNPAGVNVHPNGNIYVADYHNDVVRVYDPSLNLIQTLGSTRGSAPGQFSEPWDIAFDSEGKVFVTDTNNVRIQVFNSLGVLQYTFPTGESYQGLAINNDDYVYVSGRQPEVFLTNGTPLGKIPLGQNYYPRNMAIDGGNRVIFSNMGNQSGCCVYDENNNLTIQTPKGEFLQKIDLDYQPYFVDVDEKNRIWVTDHTNNKVHVYASDGAFIKTFDFGGGSTTENPVGLEIEGNILYLTSHVTDKVEIYEISPDNATWVSGMPGGTPRDYHSSVVYDGKIYSWGGHPPGTGINSLDIYDISSDSWSTGPSGGTPRKYHKSVIHDGKIYSWGGDNGVTGFNSIDIYDIASETWSTGTPGGTARRNHSSVLYNGKIYSWGGMPGIGVIGNGYLNTIDIYDIAADSWSTGASGGTARYGHTAVVYNGKMYIYGGWNFSGTLGSVDVYDINSDTWQTGVSIGTARAFHTSVLDGGKIYSWGGYSGGPSHSDLIVYDIESNSWATGTPGGTARHNHTSVLDGGKIYSWGGYNGSYLNSLDIYDISLETAF